MPGPTAATRDSRLSEARDHTYAEAPSVRSVGHAAHGPGDGASEAVAEESGAGRPGVDPHESGLIEVQEKHADWGRRFNQAFPGDPAVAAMIEYFDALTQGLIDLNRSLKREGVAEARERGDRLSGSVRAIAAAERTRANDLAREYFYEKTALKVRIDRWWTDSEPPVQPFLRGLDEEAEGSGSRPSSMAKGGTSGR